MAPYRLSTEQRRYFYELCSAGNITQAAQDLYLSRQGLSRSMRSLEDSVGAELFTRGKKGVQLTRAGRELLRYLSEEDRAWEACVARLRTMGRTIVEPVRVGLLSMFVGYESKHRLLSHFTEDEGLRVDILDGDHDFCWQAIMAGDMECAVTMRPPNELGLPSIRLVNDTLSVMLSVDDPLARKSTIDFARDLRGKTVVQTSPYKGKLYETLFRNHGILSEPIMHDRNLMLAHVSSRQQCFIIQTEYARRLETDEVCRRPLVNAPFDLASFLVFSPDLSERGQRVARTIADAYGHADEFDAYFNAKGMPSAVEYVHLQAV